MIQRREPERLLPPPPNGKKGGNDTTHLVAPTKLTSVMSGSCTHDTAKNAIRQGALCKSSRPNSAKRCDNATHHPRRDIQGRRST